MVEFQELYLVCTDKSILLSMKEEEAFPTSPSILNVQALDHPLLAKTSVVHWLEIHARKRDLGSNTLSPTDLTVR